MASFDQDGRERAVGAAEARGRLISVSRARHIAAPPEAVFAVLADPAALAGLMPHIKSVELLEQGDAWARVATSLQLTPFNTLRAEGVVRWQGMREIVFSTRQPVGVETRLELRPTATGTNLYATLTLDLAPMLGPLAAFIPYAQVAAVTAPDLEAMLNTIAAAAEQR
jgi:hypothetical protein